MKYRKFGKTGENVSVLGFGMMRLPMLDGSAGNSYRKGAQADIQASIDMLRKAIDSGINYVDTAYNYLSGMSEKITGMALKDGYRQRVYLATKAPVWLYNEPDDFDTILDKQLSRLQTGYIDFYMLHGLNKNNWRDKVLKLGLLKKLSDAKISGKIKHIGFSFHDSLSVFKEIADYTDIWEFCQIQLNYIDTKFQAGIEGLKYASGKGLGVAVMEPLRGGYLSTLPESVSSIFKSAGISKSPTELALDYLWDMPEVSVVLSGMSDSAMACENITFASRSEAGMLSEPDSELYKKAAAEFEKASVIPCTGCNYCNVCPMGITIPYNFMVYNSYMISGDMDRWKEQYENQVTMFGAKASECIGCKRCEEMCPQKIEISCYMPKVHNTFR